MLWEFGQRRFSWESADPGVSRGCARIMAILNVTPDSFYDGGRRTTVESAVESAMSFVEDGADIIDVGGESTRPGAPPVGVNVEAERVIPVISAIRARSDIPISIDTTKSQVADAALAAGADIINDVSALSFDEGMPEVAKKHGAGIVMMHMRGRPQTMQDGDLSSADMCVEVAAYLSDRLDALVGMGIPGERICLDPGIGFGKTVQQNMELMSNMEELMALGRPILIGASRKSYLGALTERSTEERLAGSVASTALSAYLGAQLLRVHDVGATRDAIRVADAFRSARSGGHL